MALASFAADEALFCCTAKCLQHILALPLHSPLLVAGAQPMSASVLPTIKMWDSHSTDFTPLSGSSDTLFRKQGVCWIQFSTKENITRLICPKHSMMEHSGSRRVFAFSAGISSALSRKLGKAFSPSFFPLQNDKSWRLYKCPKEIYGEKKPTPNF